MKWVAIAILVVAIALFLGQAALRRKLNEARYGTLRALFDGIVRFEITDVAGSIEGRRHGRSAGIDFVRSFTRGKPDLRSSAEFWLECHSRAPFMTKSQLVGIVEGEFESSSSQPKEFALLQSREEFNQATIALLKLGAESIVAAQGRVTVRYRPLRRELLRTHAASILDSLEELARAAEI